eukprot:6210549-Pleurochrysis_carterae.AAC.2
MTRDTKPPGLSHGTCNFNVIRGARRRYVTRGLAEAGEGGCVALPVRVALAAVHQGAGAGTLVGCSAWIDLGSSTTVH